MPPKKRKQRASSESEAREEASELLSPSEVVKMRKTSRPPKTETPAAYNEIEEVAIPTEATKEVRKQKRVREENSKKDKKEEKKVKEGVKASKKVDAKQSKILKRNPKKKIAAIDENLEAIGGVIYPCGICTKEVSDTDEAILCEAGCEFWYHRHCTGMTDVAYAFLTNQTNAEWVCDKCIATKCVPLVKIKHIDQIHA